jgi:UDP-N-acetylmuramate: L-alanyl-gamma-D-glutamyl-meso-diaminopimelate ligase
MDMADVAMVYFNPHALKLKRLPEITREQVKEAFGRDDLHVYNDSKQMLADIQSMHWTNTNLLLMSSGNFDGWDIKKIANDIVKN